MTSPPSSFGERRETTAFIPLPKNNLTQENTHLDLSPLSPFLHFYTAPSTPERPASPVPHLSITIAAERLADHASRVHSSPSSASSSSDSDSRRSISPIEDMFPTQLPADISTLEDYDGLSALEKIFVCATSKKPFHRSFIAHALPQLLKQVAPIDAVTYILPLLTTLAMDQDDTVKDALATRLASIIWWFFTKCDLTSEEPGSAPPSASASPQASPVEALVPVSSFTPILGTLLLSPNATIGAKARQAVVELLNRLPQPDVSLSPTVRGMIETEILQNIILGMGRLYDEEGEGEEEEEFKTAVDESPGVEWARQKQNHNPYFPTLPGSPSGLQRSKALPSSPLALPPITAEVPQVNGTSSPLSLSSSSVAPPRSPQSLATTLSPTSTSYRYMFERKREPEVEPVPTPVIVPEPEPEEEEEIEMLVEDDSHLQAAVGRLSSMSLIAAVAVSGALSTETERSFVDEVSRVGRDDVHWVRREAAFALGALAKVVSDDMVVQSLLPLFQSLCQDPVSHVRHSAVFALPGILARLTERERKRLSLDVILRLYQDPDSDVRSGVLESLGEVISTFCHDKEGPPETLVYLFLGVQGHRWQGSSPSVGANIRDQGGGSLTLLATNDVQDGEDATDLIRAFNYPAVTLTLGRARWKGELRRVYLALTKNRSTKVRKTLAASLGEVAKIIGPDHARQDLVAVWWDAARCEEEEVRQKLVDSIETFVTALDKTTRLGIVRGVLEVWHEGGWKGWREREGLAGTYHALINLIQADDSDVVRGLFKVALEDPVAAVREAAIRGIPTAWRLFTQKGSALNGLREDLQQLARSGQFRRRMTYVNTLHALTSIPLSLDDDLFRYLNTLATDSQLGVRISVARLVGSLFTDLDPSTIPATIRHVHRTLSMDSAADVRSFVNFDAAADMDLSVLSRPPLTTSPTEPHMWTFSRPPPASLTAR